MKNKLLKGAHLSGHKCREILELFCEDITATQIAAISGVSRVTVNNYFKLIRKSIAAYCDHDTATVISYEDDPMLAGNQRLPVVYGIVNTGGKIETTWLQAINGNILQHLQDHGNCNSFLKNIETFTPFQAIADCSDWKLYWLEDTASPAVSSLLSDIADFWSYTKGRLQKFRGMNKKMLYLHIKECEFRYNCRNEALLPLLNEAISCPQKRKSLVTVNEDYDFI
jgi:transposase